MATESRDHMLMNFMQCTGLEDFDECINILEKNQWDFQRAIRAVQEPMGLSSENNHHLEHRFSPHVSVVPKPPGVRPRTPPMDDDSDSHRAQARARPPVLPNRIPLSTASGATRSTRRELKFKVEYKDQTAHVELSEDQTVYHLKTKIQESLRVPIQLQNFANWGTKTYNDRTPLRDLKLARENEIQLIATASRISQGQPPAAAAAATATASSSSTASNAHRSQRAGASPSRRSLVPRVSDFPITVKHTDKSGHKGTYTLLLKPTTSIGEMKAEMEKHSKIPVREQIWCDLESAQDTDLLRDTAILPRATLVLRRREPPVATRHSTTTARPPAPNPSRRLEVVESMDIDDEVRPDSPIIIDDAATAAVVPSDDRELLIPERWPNETAALENFNRVFHQRYRCNGPYLFMGPLDNAVQAALFVPVADRRPLALYLHHDRSICTNIFCTQVLGSETIIEYLSNNYLVWAWDLTADSNRIKFVESLKRMSNLPNLIRSTALDRNAYPLLILLTRNRGMVELSTVIEGERTNEEVLEQLMQCREGFELQRQRDAEEENARDFRERLKRQQEDEYNQSVKADMAKDRARQNEEMKRFNEERRNEDLKQRRLREKEESESRLPSEPAEGEQNITKFKIRLPDDRVLLRRFRVKETLQNLFDYLSSEGQLFGEYRLLTAYPKRDLSTLNTATTFEALKLCPQEQFILEKI